MNLGTKLFLAAVGVAAGGYVVHRIMNPKPSIRGPRFLAGDQGVQHIYAEGQVIDADILRLVHARIDTDALADHVLHLTPRAQRQVYDIAHKAWTQTDFIDRAQEQELSDAQAKAELVRQVLGNIAPSTSWHVARQDLPKDSARARVWDATTWLVELMGASVEEQAREAETQTAATGA